MIGLASTLAQFVLETGAPGEDGSADLQSVAGHGFERGRVWRLQVGGDLRTAWPGPLALLVAAITHFGCNTAAMSTIIGLTEDKPIHKSLD